MYSVIFGSTDNVNMVDISLDTSKTRHLLEITEMKIL